MEVTKNGKVRMQQFVAFFLVSIHTYIYMYMYMYMHIHTYINIDPFTKQQVVQWYVALLQVLFYEPKYCRSTKHGELVVSLVAFWIFTNPKW